MNIKCDQHPRRLKEERLRKIRLLVADRFDSQYPEAGFHFEFEMLALPDIILTEYQANTDLKILLFDDTFYFLAGNNVTLALFCHEQGLTLGNPVRVQIKAIVKKVNAEKDVCGRVTSSVWPTYQIVGGSASISVTKGDDFFPGKSKQFFWANLQDTIQQVLLSPNRIDLKIKQTTRTFLVRHSARDADGWRFWEMTDCGDTIPAVAVETALKSIFQSSNGLPVSRLNISDSVPRVVFQSNEQTGKLREVLAPHVLLGFELPNSPRWTPKTLFMDSAGSATFQDRELFDTTAVNAQSFSFGWKFNGSQFVEFLADIELPLTSTTSDSANRTGKLWHYSAYVIDVINKVAEPAWVGYELPKNDPPHLPTDPQRFGFTAALELPLQVGEETDWKAIVAPLATAHVGGTISLTFNNLASLSEIKFQGTATDFDVQVRTPNLLAFGEALPDPDAIPAPMCVSDRLERARLVFRNVAVTGWTPPLSVKLTGLKTALFTVGRPVFIWRHVGRALLHHVSPAGRNVLVLAENSQDELVSLPDASRGLVKFEVNGAFEIRFPKEAKLGVTDLQTVFGVVTPKTAPTAPPGVAIDPRFPWLEITWKNDPNSPLAWTLYHRNLLVELGEFFRRRKATIVDEGDKPFRWTPEIIASLVRDHFAPGAIWTNLSSPVQVLNLFPNATFARKLMVLYEENPNGTGWPRASVNLAGVSGSPQYLEAFRGKKDPSPNNLPNWLAYDASVDFTGNFPAIDLKPRTPPNEQRQAQPLITQPAFDSRPNVLKVYDHGGIVRGYGDSITSSSQSTLHIRRLTGRKSSSYFAVDFDEAIFDDQTMHRVHLFCNGLIVELSSYDIQAGTFSFVPVSPDLMPELGDLGTYRISNGQRVQHETASLGENLRNTWPIAGGVPLVPFALDKIWFSNDLAGLDSQITGIDFTGVLPSPRYVAKPDSTEHATSLKRSEQLSCTARLQGGVTVDGYFGWPLEPEFPDQPGAVDAIPNLSDGPHALSGTAKYDSKTNWQLGVKEMSVRVFGLVVTRVMDEKLILIIKSGAFEFQTDGFDPTLETSYGVKLSSSPDRLPQFRVTAQVGKAESTYVAIVGGLYDGAQYGRSISMKSLQNESFILAGVHDVYFAFRPKEPPLDTMLLLWLETAEDVKVRVWRSGRVEPVTATLTIDNPLQFRGIQQKFTIDGESDNSFVSLYLESAAAVDSIRLLVASQPVNGEWTAQLGANLQRTPSLKIAGVMRLEVVSRAKEGDGEHYELKVGVPSCPKARYVYDLTAANVLPQDRSLEDIRIPGTYESLNAPQSIDLADVTPSFIEPASFFSWTVGVSSASRPAAIMHGRLTVRSNLIDTIPTAASIVAATSMTGSLFVTNRNESKGLLFRRRFGFDKVVVEVGEPIRGASFVGETLLILTSTTLSVLVGDACVPLQTVESGYRFEAIDAIGVNLIVSSNNSRGETRLYNFEYDGALYWRKVINAGQDRLIGWSDGSRRRILVARRHNGVHRLQVIDLESGVNEESRLEAMSFAQCRVPSKSGDDLDDVTWLALTDRDGNLTIRNSQTPTDIVASIPSIYGEVVAVAVWRDQFVIAVRRDESMSISLLQLGDSADESLRSHEFPDVTLIRLFSTDSHDLLAATAALDDGLLKVKIDWLAGNRLTGFKVDDADVPIDRCTGGNATRPPQDQFLVRPQIWHQQAAGLQLMSSIPKDWVSFEAQPTQSDIFSGRKLTCLVGPVVATPQGIAIVRTSLSVESPRPLPSDSSVLRTDNLLGLSRFGDVGVLLNQTIDTTSVQADSDHEWTRLLDRRGWQGITMKRTMKQTGGNTIIEMTLYVRAHSTANSWRGSEDALNEVPQVANAITPPDSRILPYDEWLVVGQLRSSKDNGLKGLVFFPGPVTHPEWLPGKAQDLRSCSLFRTAGTFPDGGKSAIELLLGDVAAFDHLPQRFSSVNAPMCPDRTYLPSRMDVIFGRGKPGAVISSRMQACLRPSDPSSPAKFASSTLFSLRDPLALANSSSPQLSGFNFSKPEPVQVGAAKLQEFRRTTVEWTSTLTIVVSDADPLPDSPFLENVNNQYKFLNGVRRVFALATYVDGKLIENPSYRRVKTDLVRAPESTSIAIEFRDGFPRLFVVAHVDLNVQPTVKNGSAGDKFDLKVVFDETQSFNFSQVFRPLIEGIVPGFKLWTSRLEDSDIARQIQLAWKTANKIEMRWEKQGESSVVICPWSNADSVSEKSSLDLHHVRGGEPTYSIVFSELDNRRTILSFDQVAGGVIRTDAVHLKNQGSAVALDVGDKFSATVETVVRNPSDLKAQLIASLPSGEVLGASSPNSASRLVNLEQKLQ